MASPEFARPSGSDSAMRLPRFRLTVERLMIALVPVVAGTLVVGSISCIRCEASLPGWYVTPLEDSRHTVAYGIVLC
jgi:hypothetical protein